MRGQLRALGLGAARAFSACPSARAGNAIGLHGVEALAVVLTEAGQAPLSGAQIYRRRTEDPRGLTELNLAGHLSPRSLRMRTVQG
eukprot:2665705-Pleurochrysis_carterae.AAC.1